MVGAMVVVVVVLTVPTERVDFLAKEPLERTLLPSGVSLPVLMVAG